MHAQAMTKTLGAWEQFYAKQTKKETKKVIAYASKQMAKHDKNYTPFLVEMAAMTLAMDHFNTYLKGKNFILYSDHKSLETSGKKHERTLNKIKEFISILKKALKT